ncbi:MAG: leucyl aminopeptidase [Candidatus Bipolaricaulota bacterium]|nr:leucyl aminopeptidase [Candidatus Bipolaricaulota bacterium]MDW8031075.1 leucyl aminopeptidase [Candidatus Bipolaricaulota bacterium]
MTPIMQVRVEQGDITRIATEAICLGIFQGVQRPGGAAGAVDRALDGALSEVLTDGDFSCKKGEVFWLRTHGKIGAKRVLLVGLGSSEKFSADVVREVSAAAARAAKSLSELTTIAHGAGIGGLDPQIAAQATIEGTLLGLYRFEKFKKPEEPIKLERLRIVEHRAEKLEQLQIGARRGQIIAESVCFARDLANEPGQSLPPRELARRAQGLAQELGLRCEVFDEKALEQLGMGGILAVGKGSDEPPRFIVLEYNVTKDSQPIVLAGKGITFDSGGISIKPREGMEAMKYDMSGAAAVLGAMRAVALLKLPISVVGLIAAAENLPSGKAIKPGDVIQISNGKTVEVTNTDAEGRLVLADALVYAQRYNPHAVIDVATLTGACTIALGKEAAGLFSNDESLAQKIQRAAQQTGERVWPLPLYEEYKELIKSEIADIKNSMNKGPLAGASIGAIFLKEFVNYPWAHLDIAGVAYDVESRLYHAKGATGYGVRLLTQLLQNWT